MVRSAEPTQAMGATDTALTRGTTKSRQCIAARLVCTLTRMADLLNPTLLVLSLHVVAVCLLWVHARAAALVMGLTLALAWQAGLVDLRGVLSALLVGSTALAAQVWATKDWPAHRLVRLVTALMCLALALHLMPGFHNPRLLDQVPVRDGATPYTLHASLDKGLAGWLLLAMAGLRWQDRRVVCAGLRDTVAPMVLTCIGVIGLGWAMGRVQWEGRWPMPPQAPHAAWVFLVVNLFITCVAEEAFFRGWLQGGLQGMLNRLLRRHWRGHPQGLTVRALQTLPGLFGALTFGLAHAAGGPQQVVLATLAGLGCAWAFHRTGSIEAAVLVHFALNALHFLAFTYPALA